jgi:DNA repair protein RadD
MKLRQYQNDAVSSIYTWFERGMKAPLIVTPTGSGKSVILAEFIRQAIEMDPTTKILVVTHVKELIKQDYEKIKILCPHLSVGIYSAGIGKRQVSPVTVASIFSIHNKQVFFGRFDLIIVDEAHLIPHKSDGVYRKFIDACTKANPYTKVIGLTATPYRLSSGLLYEGEGAIFDGISYEVPIGDLIDAKFLSPLVAVEGADVDLKGIKKIAGDFHERDLGERMAAKALVEAHCDIIVNKCAQRKSWLIFCVTVDHVMKIDECLRTQHNITTGVVTGETPKGERDRIIEDFKAGKIQAVVNCSVLTTGFDHPGVDAIAMLRPTMSPGLYVQMAGRGLRIADGKTNCLILDFGGNVIRHGLIDMVKPPRKPGEKSEGTPPVKKCERCGTLCPISLLVCKECEYVFPVAERESYEKSYAGAMLSKDVAPPKDFFVDKMECEKHEAKSGANTLRIDFWCGFRKFSKHVCLEHAGYARIKAESFWTRELGGQVPVPATVDEALQRISELKTPGVIVVNLLSKFPEIVAVKQQQQELGELTYAK